jgi:hypothetical protein
MIFERGISESRGVRFFNAGIIAPTAVLCDDKPETVEPYWDYFCERGFNTILTKTVDSARAFFRQLNNDAAYLFDMHMPPKKIGKRTTAGGTAVGLALIYDITSDGTGSLIDHCATLTAYKTTDAELGEYDFLEERGQKIARISKNDDLEGFEEFVAGYEKSYISTIRIEQGRRNVKAVRMAFGELSHAAGTDAEDEIAAILGYRGVDKLIWHKNFDAILSTASADFRERIEALYYIKHGLALHFGVNEIEEQREWAQMKRDELGGRSVWSCLTSGEIDQLFAVTSLVNRTIG